MKRSSKFVPVVVIALASVGACGSPGSGSSASPGSSSGGSAASKQTVNIGFLANLTGPGQPYAVPFSKGMKLAFKDAQSELDAAKVSIKIDEQDTASVEANAVTLFNKFAQAGDQVTVSDSQSPIGLAIAPLANSRKVLFVSGAGSKLPNDNGYAFHVADLGTPMKTLGQQLQANGSKRVASIVDGSNPSFPTLVKATEGAFTAAGGSAFVGTQQVRPGDSDFSSVLTNLAKSNPDTILISALSDQSGNIIRQIKQTSSLANAKIAGTIAWGPQVYDVAKDAAVGAVFAAVWAPGEQGSANFESAWKAAYGDTPVAYSALGYETGWILVAAMKQVAASGGKVTSDSLKQALPAAATSDLVKQHGPIPGFTLPADGAAQYPGVLAVFGSNGAIKAGT